MEKSIFKIRDYNYAETIIMECTIDYVISFVNARGNGNWSIIDKTNNKRVFDNFTVHEGYKQYENLFDSKLLNR